MDYRRSTERFIFSHSMKHTRGKVLLELCLRQPEVSGVGCAYGEGEGGRKGRGWSSMYRASMERRGGGEDGEVSRGGLG